eukprot:NODE_7772_length_577_cov_59.782222_g7749_i0.p1 GENE.NODE_7772_length_577_cov_59.782222_g7749_i0~~NODE_7772_length_577_cov_59.782222_g7749_i0.p1  ORF type:complete len:133 (-),score=31.30 NODE_7772_length_577_cov_59.782222_g7749_i0:116-514(-)
MATVAQMELVKASFKQVEDCGATAAVEKGIADVVLASSSADALKELFEENDMDEPGEELFRMVGVVVEAEDVAALLTKQAKRHSKYGVEADMYPVVIKAVMDSLATNLPDFSDDTREAWAALFQQVQSTMAA